jgi:ankyrin repeat protein
MKDLTILHAKFKNNQEFTDKDLFFIYEVFGSIKSFSQQADPRRSEILKSRDRTEDFIQIFGQDKYTELLNTRRDSYHESLLEASFRNKETVTLILNAAENILSPEELKKFLLQTDSHSDNALTLAASNGNKEIITLILNTAEKILSPDELKKFLSQTNFVGDNALMCGVSLNKQEQEVVSTILSAAKKILNPDELKKFLSHNRSHNMYDDNALMMAVSNGNKETVTLILNTAENILSPEELKKFLSHTNHRGNNALSYAKRNIKENQIAQNDALEIMEQIQKAHKRVNQSINSKVWEVIGKIVNFTVRLKKDFS